MGYHFVQRLLCASFVGGFALAQSTTQPEAKPGDRLDTVFAELDTDGNGMVPMEEFVKACQSSSFRNLDTNADGAIGLGEWLVMEKHPGAQAQFRLLDANDDLNLSPAEFFASAGSARRWQAVFGTLDKDGDKRLRKSDFKTR